MDYAKATTADIDAVMTIIEGAKRSLAARGIDQWQRGYPNRESVENDIRRGVGRKGMLNGRVVVYGAAIYDGEAVYRAPSVGAWLTDVPYVVVHRLCTLPDVGRQGLAAEFLRHVEDEARGRGFGSFRIDTHPENDYMRRLLERLYFSPCCEVWIESRRIGYEKILR